jgi:hypothetical protein
VAPSHAGEGATLRCQWGDEAGQLPNHMETKSMLHDAQAYPATSSLQRNAAAAIADMLCDPSADVYASLKANWGLLSVRYHEGQRKVGARIRAERLAEARADAERRPPEVFSGDWPSRRERRDVAWWLLVKAFDDPRERAVLAALGNDYWRKRHAFVKALCKHPAFADLSPRSRPRAVRKVLQRLEEAGVIERKTRRLTETGLTWPPVVEQVVCIRRQQERKNGHEKHSPRHNPRSAQPVRLPAGRAASTKKRRKPLRDRHNNAKVRFVSPRIFLETETVVHLKSA